MLPVTSEAGEKHNIETPSPSDPQEAEQSGPNDTEATITPGSIRNRRRRSRSRGSRSGTPKLEIPPSSTTGVISPVQRPTTPAAAITISPSIDAQPVETYRQYAQTANIEEGGQEQPSLQANLSPPSATPTQSRNRAFITHISPFHQSPLFVPGQAYTPIGPSGPPTLAELQSNLAAGGLSRSVSVGRAHALHKLTGGNMSATDSDLFSQFTGTPRTPEEHLVNAVATTTQATAAVEGNAANTPPPAGLMARSNTVAGGERIAARTAMFNKLKARTGPTTPNALNTLLEPTHGLPIGDAGHLSSLSSSNDPTIASENNNGHDVVHEGGLGIAGVPYDENVPHSGTEEVLVMPAIVAREKENKRRRRHRRRSSNTTGLGSLSTIPGSDETGSVDHTEGGFVSADDRRFGSDVNSASTGTTPASQFSPLPTAHGLPISNTGSYSNLIRGTPSPRPAFTPPPAQPLDAIVSSIHDSSPRIGPRSGLVPDVPGGSRRIEELNDIDIQKQEEMQARYYQGINVMRAASGGSQGTGSIRVLIEEDDEPLPVPVMEPTSPVPETSSLSPKATSRPSIDSVELEPPKRPLHDSASGSIVTTTDDHSQTSPGFDSIMGRVPIVMHKVGQDGQSTGFGRKRRAKDGSVNEGDGNEPLANFEPFPISAVLTPGKDQPAQYSKYSSDADEGRRGSEQQSMDNGRLAPAPRSWQPKSSSSWIVDSYCEYLLLFPVHVVDAHCYLQVREGNITQEGHEQPVQTASSHSLPGDHQQGSQATSASPIPSKGDWGYDFPQNNIYSSRASPGPTPTAQSAVPDEAIPSVSLDPPATNAQTSSPSSRQDAPTPAPKSTTEDDMGHSSDEKASSFSGEATRGGRSPFGSGIGARGQEDSQYSMSQIPEDDDGSTERKSKDEKVSGWTRVKQTLTRRRSRSNSFARERGEKVESGISRESGGSLQQQMQQHLASNTLGGPSTTNLGAGLQPSPSGMLSVTSVPRGVSPLPPPSPGDFAKYNDSKLMPFPGLYQLEEQRNYRKAQSATSEQGASLNVPLVPHPAALSAPLPPSARDSPDEGTESNGRGLQRNVSLGNMRQQDRSWPLPQEDYFESGGSVSRNNSAGSNVKKWLKVMQHGPTSNSASPSPSPYPYPISYSPAPSNISQGASQPNLNRRPSAAEIFLPSGGLQRRPSTPNLLQGLSRKPSLADTGTAGGNGQSLKTITSKSSLRRAFGLFGQDSTTKDNQPSEQEASTFRTVARPENAIKSEDSASVPVTTMQTSTSQPTASVENPRSPSPVPLALPPPSTVPIPAPSSTQPEPPRTGPTPPPVNRIRSPPPIGSRPQSPLARAQSPSILKKQPEHRAQSPPVRAQSPVFDFVNVISPHVTSPRSHSPFLVNSPSLTRLKSSRHKDLNSAEILASIDSLLSRNSTGSFADSRAKFMEEPPRKLLLVTPVLQVVSKDAVKDRTLFLFSDILLITKCLSSTEGGLPMDKPYVVKSIIELKRCSGPTLSFGSRDLSGDRRSPLLQSFIGEFQNDQIKAIKRLCDAMGIRRDEATFIADVLFRTHELSRSRLGDYLAMRNNRDVLHAFVDKFNFSGIRIDHALRIFLLSILLSDNAERRSLENLLAGFAARWFHANSSMVSFDKECAKNLVISIVLLNASLHMSQAHSYPPATQHDFFEAVRAYDPRRSIKDDLLEDIYEAVKQEKISAPKENPGDARLTVTINGATNLMHFIYRVKSDVVRVRIPAPDPNFRVHLLGQDLLFEPPTLHFADSPEATFRVTGTSLGPRSILYWRAGANAHLYNAMPLASDIVIERAFMRNTLKLEVKEPALGREQDSLDESDRESAKSATIKKKYVFSIEDSREYEHWGKVLKTSVNRALGIVDPDRPPTAQGIYTPVTATFGGTVPPRIRRATDTVAFEVLKETLIGRDSHSSV